MAYDIYMFYCTLTFFSCFIICFLRKIWAKICMLFVSSRKWHEKFYLPYMPCPVPYRKPLFELQTKQAWYFNCCHNFPYGIPKHSGTLNMHKSLSVFRVEYDTFDILTDEEVRQGLKTYSNWPTYPQLYVKGELVGGLDIIKVNCGKLSTLSSIVVGS